MAPIIICGYILIGIGFALFYELYVRNIVKDHLKPGTDSPFYYIIVWPLFVIGCCVGVFKLIFGGSNGT